MPLLIRTCTFCVVYCVPSMLKKYIYYKLRRYRKHCVPSVYMIGLAILTLTALSIFLPKAESTRRTCMLGHQEARDMEAREFKSECVREWTTVRVRRRLIPTSEYRELCETETLGAPYSSAGSHPLLAQRWSRRC